MNTTFLARFFDKVREIVEAAETPFSKLAIFVLPILAPIVPASFTGMHLYKLLGEVFAFADWISITLATLVGLVLEMLGYVGAIEFIHHLLRLTRDYRSENWIPVILTGVAYTFYLLAMFLINVQLGKYFQTPPIVNSIIGLLSFITIPTGLLAANHLSQRAVSEEDYVLRQEKREDKLKSKMIKQGINPMGFTAMHDAQRAQASEKKRHAGDYKEFVFELLDHKGKLPLTEITDMVNKNKRVDLVHKDVKGTWYKYVQEWERSRDK
jgi:hypothetical protein